MHGKKNQQHTVLYDVNTDGPHFVVLLNRDTLTPESVVCETTRVWRAEPKSPVQVFFDGARITLDQAFIYRDDPVITGIHPRATIREWVGIFFLFCFIHSLPFCLVALLVCMFSFRSVKQNSQGRTTLMRSRLWLFFFRTTFLKPFPCQRILESLLKPLVFLHFFFFFFYKVWTLVLIESMCGCVVFL